MRLIDADKLLDFIDVGHLRHPSELCYSEMDLVNMINHMPTAYDVDEVVEQMSENVAIDRAIEIVKDGGIDE